MSIIEITKENFEEKVLNNKCILIDFYADWCGPCRMLRPTLEEIASERNDCQFGSVNTDKEEELAIKYNISSIPCLILFNDGKEVARSIGLKPKEEIEELIGGK